jgi:hypothetical protein
MVDARRHLEMTSNRLIGGILLGRRSRFDESAQGIDVATRD